MTKETIKTFQYRITQATASQLVVILYDMAIEYLNDAWRFKHNALFLSRDIPNILNRRAREAFFSTCSVFFCFSIFLSRLSFFQNF